MPVCYNCGMTNTYLPRCTRCTIPGDYKNDAERDTERAIREDRELYEREHREDLVKALYARQEAEYKFCRVFTTVTKPKPSSGKRTTLPKK